VENRTQSFGYRIGPHLKAEIRRPDRQSYHEGRNWCCSPKPSISFRISVCCFR